MLLHATILKTNFREECSDSIGNIQIFKLWMTLLHNIADSLSIVVQLKMQSAVCRYARWHRTVTLCDTV